MSKIINDEKEYMCTLLDVKGIVVTAGQTIESFIDTMISPMSAAIPVVSILKETFDIFHNVYKNHLLKKTLAVMMAVSQGYDEEKINQYKEKIINNDVFASDETSRIILIINRSLEYEKTYLIGKLWMSLILGNLDHIEFMQFALMVDSIYYCDYVFLRKFVDGNLDDNLSDFDKASFYRLQAVGLMKDSTSYNDGTLTLGVTENTKVAKRFLNALDSYSIKRAIDNK